MCIGSCLVSLGHVNPILVLHFRHGSENCVFRENARTFSESRTSTSGQRFPSLVYEVRVRRFECDVFVMCFVMWLASPGHVNTYIGVTFLA